MELSPGMRNVEPYPFEELDRRKREALDAGRDLIDLGVGDPRDETPAFIRDAARAAIAPTSSYPRAAGLPELRDAIVAWADRRFGVTLDPSTDLIPTLGSKEPIFSLAQAVLDPGSGRDLVLVTAPGYTIPERGARFAGGDAVRLPLAAPDFLPDLDGIDGGTWGRAGILWLNYPNNPTGATAPLAFLEHAADLARRHDVLLALDEAYSELWFDDGPPASGLQLGDLTNVVVLNTLSKRSNMTGYRSGFMAGDARLIAAMKALRPSTGVTPRSSSNARPSPPGATRPTCRSSASDTPTSARSSSTCSGGWASRSPGAWRACTCGSRCRPADPPSHGRSSSWSADWWSRRFVLRGGRGGLRADGDGRDARRLRSCRRVLESALSDDEVPA